MTPMQPEIPKVPPADQLIKTQPFPIQADLDRERADKQIHGGTLTEKQVLTLLKAIGRQENFLNDSLDQAEDKQPDQVPHWQQRLADFADAKRALEEFLAPLSQDISALDKLDEAERIVSDLVRRTPPSHAHTELADLLSRFAAVKREISEKQEPEP